MDWRALEAMEPEMVSWRRHLHMYPELSFQEERTGIWIADKLKSFGISVQTGIGGHGVIATLAGLLEPADGRKPVHVALRADIDALPITDEKDVSFRSRVPGVMHACGHDGHTSTLLAVASWLSAHRNQWCGKVTFLFQPAEEVNPGGALSLIEAGGLDGVDCIFGVHLWTPMPTGMIGSCAGAMFASVDEFQIDIHGRGGHAALPHQTIDSVLVGAQLVQTLQTVVSRSVDPLEQAVVTVGSFHSGHTFNVIAERAQLKGTVRTFQPEVRLLAEQRIRQIAEHTAVMHGARVDMMYHHGYPSVINDPYWVGRAETVCGEWIQEAQWQAVKPVMAGEDFAYYLHQVPGCFVFVGAGNPEEDAVYPHHHPRFTFDEKGMLIAAKLLIGLAMDAFFGTEKE